MRGSLRRILLFFVGFLTITFAVIVVNQTLQLTEFADRIHPTAGTIVFWSLIVTYLVCLTVPVILYYRLPEALKPPESEDGPGFERHLQKLGKRLGANPLTSNLPLESREEIERATGQLDGHVEELMSQAASRVFLTTAVSQNGSLDALVVLAAQLKLIWDVAHVYSQRPTLRDMGSLYTNVLGTAFVAGQLEEVDLSEQIQPVLSSVLGSAAGAVPGLQVASTVFVNSVITGSANAFLTLRVGAIARAYSRALVRQERSALRRSATATAAAMLGSIAVRGAAKVSKAIAKASGRGVGGVLSGLGGKVKGAGATLVEHLSFGKGGSSDSETDRS
jgi:hypothetical protein